MFVDGHKKFGGWNQETKERRRRVSDMFYNVYHGIGGDEAFMQWASKEENRKDFYKMLSKQLPTEVSLSGSNDPTPINIYLPAIAAKL
ncbi:hypothetical protein AGMMS50222_06020 [Endomicrobiia bacterium]|nr:hypothetical protein AGMMS49531_03530 [Endomicrobiia bacterium]GHT75304.1 hypothetical protein AGMMS50222_06020 [Endomicrobiia bacterium]